MFSRQVGRLLKSLSELKLRLQCRVLIFVVTTCVYNHLFSQFISVVLHHDHCLAELLLLLVQTVHFIFLIPVLMTKLVDLILSFFQLLLEFIDLLPEDPVLLAQYAC